MAGLAQLLAEKGHPCRQRGYGADLDSIHSFDVARTRHVMLADPRSSYVSGARIAATAGEKILSDRLQSRGGQPTEPRTTMLATAEPSFAARPAYVSRGNFAIVVTLEGN
jgi:hypothetical protein